MINVRDLTFAYPDGTLVFEGFNWHVGAGEAWARRTSGVSGGPAEVTGCRSRRE